MGRISNDKEALLLNSSIEIWAHLLVFAAIFTPLIALILPAVVISFATFVVIQLAGDIFIFINTLSLTQTSFGALMFFSAIILLARFTCSYREFIYLNRKENSELAGRLRQPKGAAGQVLRDTITKIWLLTPNHAKPAPEVDWYSGFQVEAQASFKDGVDHIYVSSALWDRVNKQDLTAELILAHEMGHVVYNDWRTFRRLSFLLHGIRSILRFSKVFTICATVVLLFLIIIKMLLIGEEMWPVARLEFAIIAIAILCFLLLTLLDLFLRRYASFIVAMMEVRADLSAALWTTGLDSFTKQLESDKTLHHSTVADLSRSFFSPDMTHLSESERLTLIRTPDRLFTPKLRYFAYSVILALLLPINPITPLLLNGSIDHIIIVLLVAVLYGITLTMLVLMSFSQTVSWKRSAILATAVCCALGSTKFNMYEFGYLLTHYSIAIANDRGFTIDPILWSDLGGDLEIVAHGLAKKVLDGIHSWWILASVLITTIAIKLVQPAVRSSRPQEQKQLLAYVAGSITFLVAMLAGHDPYRSELYDYVFILHPGGFQNLWLSAEPINLALPAVIGLISVFVLRLVLERSL
ncbi:hypothetical protein RHD99_06565 [Buttiauxella selenatireducens]|uniref:Peptidase M48 domain-containing protein n=1 Tax=Buttiauxella selenatireducens TaxID=3073902 RepID=A0ABY9SEJ7_9ENTR|nr:hypothetical protein [Buttiauxella sp. R73]WMY75605.1 hypothetical protein RHD99_06565 [Buttiauxella sp. R73]